MSKRQSKASLVTEVFETEELAVATTLLDIAKGIVKRRVDNAGKKTTSTPKTTTARANKTAPAASAAPAEATAEAA